MKIFIIGCVAGLMVILKLMPSKEDESQSLQVTEADTRSTRSVASGQQMMKTRKNAARTPSGAI